MPYFMILLTVILILILFILFVLMIVVIATLQEFPTMGRDHVTCKLKALDLIKIWLAMALCATIIGESPLMCIVGDDLGICIALRFLCLCCCQVQSISYLACGQLPPHHHHPFVECALWPNLEHVWPPYIANPIWVNCMHRVVGMRDEGCGEESEAPRQTPIDSFISKRLIYQILRSNTSCCRVVHVLNCAMIAILVLFEVRFWLSHANLLVCQSMHRLYKSVCYLICRQLRINTSKYVKECTFSTLSTITKVI